MSIQSKGYTLRVFILCAFTLAVRVQAEEVDLKRASLDLSFRNEIQHSIDRGLAWLTTNQNASGWWSSPDHPATTALALSAFMGAPEKRYRTNPTPAVTRGYEYIVDSAKPDGSIYRTALKNYNTAISVTALVMAGNPAYEPILRRGRAFLISSQNDFGEPGKTDDPFDGGVGYGDKYKHSDMNNTLFALEAIRATEYLVRDKKDSSDAKDLNWSAAIQFLQNCQNLPSHNSQPWVSQDPKDKGGFVYYPGQSMAGGVTNAATGAVALRSYGSISYAGLMSYIYADLKKEDPRVAAVLEWLRSNYTLQENPGMGQEGLYYYLHLMTKALSAAGVDTLELKDGTKIDWRRAVAMRLLNLQRPDGSWLNENNRWWEKDPNLVTSYAVMALDLIWWNGQPRSPQL
jgi:squalene-hopene/tetraprenyl-beta-curcumene cyclase